MLELLPYVIRALFGGGTRQRAVDSSKAYIGSSVGAPTFRGTTQQISKTRTVQLQVPTVRPTVTTQPKITSGLPTNNFIGTWE